MRCLRANFWPGRDQLTTERDPLNVSTEFMSTLNPCVWQFRYRLKRSRIPFWNPCNLSYVGYYNGRDPWTRMRNRSMMLRISGSGNVVGVILTLERTAAGVVCNWFDRDLAYARVVMQQIALESARTSCNAAIVASFERALVVAVRDWVDV